MLEQKSLFSVLPIRLTYAPNPVERAGARLVAERRSKTILEMMEAVKSLIRMANESAGSNARAPTSIRTDSPHEEG